MKVETQSLWNSTAIDRHVMTPTLGGWNLTPEQIVQKEQFLENIKNKIGELSKVQHIEILKIIKQNSSVKVNENRNGVYINLSYVPQDTIDQLVKYLDYVKDQESNLEQLEMKKEEIKTIFDT